MKSDVESDAHEKSAIALGHVGSQGLTFKRSLWFIFAAIATIQTFEVGLVLYFGGDVKELPPVFFRISELGGIVWYLALGAVAYFDLKAHGVSPIAAFNIDPRVVKQRLPQTIKYFLGCAIFVVSTSFLSSETELQLEHRTSFTVLLSFMTAVILAPVGEEMAFRGYLYTAMLSHFKGARERMVVNAMLFAGAHVLLVQFILGAAVPYYIFVLGFLIAKLYEESRSIAPCVILHALNNGLVFLIDFTKITYLQ